MTEYPRDVFKTDPVLSKLHEVLKANHKVADHTERDLVNNRHIENFCQEAVHFTILPGKDPIYISYDVASCLEKGDRILVVFEKITVYDTSMEYNTAFMAGKYSKNYTEHLLSGPIKK